MKYGCRIIPGDPDYNYVRIEYYTYCPSSPIDPVTRKLFKEKKGEFPVFKCTEDWHNGKKLSFHEECLSVKESKRVRERYLDEIPSSYITIYSSINKIPKGLCSKYLALYSRVPNIVSQD